jgi:opacity protein-like surface antigen
MGRDHGKFPACQFLEGKSQKARSLSPLKAVRNHLMKKPSILALVLFGFATVSLRAGGPEVYKQVASPPPPVYGTGFYGAIDLGANVFQNFPDGRTFTDDNPNSPFFGESLEVSPQHDVGFFGGLKLGYVFGTGVIRPAVELDSFYNGFDTDTNFTLREPDGDVISHGSSSNRLNSGVWLGNFILRFAPGNQRFQPYVGAGVGIYYAEADGLSFTGPNGETFNTGGGRSHTDLAWDVVGGSDYFFTPKVSAFIEYRFLQYTSTQFNTDHDRALNQHLVGAGVRFFFP